MTPTPIPSDSPGGRLDISSEAALCPRGRDLAKTGQGHSSGRGGRAVCSPRVLPSRLWGVGQGGAQSHCRQGQRCTCTWDTWMQGPGASPPRVWACISVCAEPSKAEAVGETMSGSGRAQAGWLPPGLGLGGAGQMPLPSFISPLSATSGTARSAWSCRRYRLV